MCKKGAYKHQWEISSRNKVTTDRCIKTKLYEVLSGIEDKTL